MKQLNLAAIIVIALFTLDFSISMVHADQTNKVKYKIYKVTKVSRSGKLHLRAWPSGKSRIKASLPYNAKDLVETGKQINKGQSRWVQVKWQEQTGWVNARYIKKTGVLVRNAPDKTKPVIASRNNKSIQNAQSVAQKDKENKIENKEDKETVAAVVNDEPHKPVELPNEYQGDRYDQTLKPTPVHPVQVVAKKMTYSPRKETQDSSKWLLECAGTTPQNWKVTMDVADKKLYVKLAGKDEFSVPITYRKWAPGGQVRMEVGGGKGRNLVDATLEKTFACNNGLSKKNYSYMVNVAVNRGQLLSGCCNPVSK